MVATVVLQLVGEGRLALTDTVDRWLPGILPYGDRVTVRHLLTMTSGVPPKTATAGPPSWSTSTFTAPPPPRPSTRPRSP
ncbi:MAG TPA: serine hydrolase domain-containing protein [Actinoplanes sp.]|nr:serine hydrolase domain-containing protein [Actinoplanes sp.]